MNWRLFFNSLAISGLTALLAGAVGFAVALALACAEAPWRRRLLVGAVVAVALPPFLITNTWLDLLGPGGVLHRWVPLKLYGPGGVIWLLTLWTWPITTLLALGSWSRLEPAQLEADPALRGPALVRWLLWPMARTAVRLALLITFALVLNHFSVPVILQVPVFPEELWLAFTTRLEDAGAWAAAWPTIAVPLAVLLLLRQSEITWPRTQGTATATVLRRQVGRGIVRTCAGVATVLYLVSLAVPFTQLVASARTWMELPTFLRASPDVVWNSFAGAAAAATMGVAIGFVSWRLPLAVVSWLPFLVPGVLLGRAAIALFNGTVLYPTAGLVVVLLAFRYLAIGWNGVSFAMRSVDRDLADMAALSGARGWTRLRHVQWPQIGPQVAAAWYVTYLLCLWDVETLVLIQPPGGETLALRIFNMLHYGHHAQVNAACVALLALALAPLVLWQVAGGGRTGRL